MPPSSPSTACLPVIHSTLTPHSTLPAPSSLLSLPPEILLKILINFPPPSLLALRATCKALRAFLDSRSDLWQASVLRASPAWLTTTPYLLKHRPKYLPGSLWRPLTRFAKLSPRGWRAQWNAYQAGYAFLVQVRSFGALALTTCIVFTTGSHLERLVSYDFGRDAPRPTSNEMVRPVPAELLSHDPAAFFRTHEGVLLDDAVEVQKKPWRAGENLMWMPAIVIAVGSEEFTVRVWGTGKRGVVRNRRDADFGGWRKMTREDDGFWMKALREFKKYEARSGSEVWEP